jgi:hypothetical protein
MKIIIAIIAVGMMAGCATEKLPVSALGSYMINVKVEGANGTNTLKTLIMMDDGTVRWR